MAGMDLIRDWRGVWILTFLVTLFSCTLAHCALNGYEDCGGHQRLRRRRQACTVEDNVRFDTFATYGVRATSAMIYWIMHYQSINCAVDHYKVTLTRIEHRACPSSAMSSRDMIYVAKGSSRMEVTGLDPYTTYNVRVTAESANNFVLADAGIISLNTQRTAPPPVNITRVEVGPASITIHWMPLTCANVGGDFNYYDVTLGESRHLMLQGLSTSSTQFLQLEPCISYSLSIRAMASGQPGSASTRIASTTSLSVSVVSPQVVQVNSTSLKVKWTEHGSCPGQKRKPSVLVSYQLIRRVACPRHSVGDNEQISRSVTGRRVVLTGLEPYSTYRITVTGANNQSTEVEATTSNGVLVDSAEMSQANSTAVAVRWVVRGGCPDQTSRPQVRVTHQLIRREACPTVVAYNQPVMSQYITQSPVVLTGLEPYATYRIRVVSASMAEVLLTTSSADPRSVASLRAEYWNKDSITFAWNRPACEDLRGNIQGYEYKLVQQSNQRVISDGLTTTTSKEFNNLIPCTSYEFRIRVVTETDVDTRYSERESLTRSTRNDAAPGLAQNVSIGQLTSREAHVTWNRPTEPPCPVNYYRVTYQVLNRDLCIPSSSYRIDDGWVRKFPGPPTNVTVLSVTETEAIVTWQRPNPQYFTITGYNLTYEAIGWQDKDQSRFTINVACEALCQRNMQTKLNALHSGTLYSLQLPNNNQFNLPTMKTFRAIAACYLL
ncbi:phosphatidylinositol phosphatase PTPRQ-like [Diadema setosum]|uniref:phosphatidylinositol phosphatase PTPRQ-like n=1 Tax=Diadema setosum TaxID=31175 RepID=UPI003B3A5389